MIRDDIKKCSIYDEFSEHEKQQYFSCTEKKVIYNIDTLYYSMSLNEEQKEQIDRLIQHLAEQKQEYIAGNKDIQIKELSFMPVSFSIYEYCLRLENMYDIFIGRYLPNYQTPRIIVQLRSIGLWADGAKTMIQTSSKKVIDILKDFKIEVLSINENRIDYAFHTNIIQNTTKYFSDRNMKNSLKTELEIYHKVGTISDKIEIDYLSLGNRKSNNVFFRSYNKTREVIEKNYKGVFIEIWHRNGMISNYDRWVLERAYQISTYNGLEVARIEWYLNYGNSESLKKSLIDLKKKYYTNSDNHEFLKRQLCGVLPAVTMITNIEFQTKRKFYKTMDDFILHLKCSVDKDNLYNRIFKIIENPKSFTDYLTGVTVKFVSGDEMASWWKRIRSVKIKSLDNSEVYRSYIRKLDKDKLLQRTAGTIASNSIYRNNVNDNDFTEDVSDLLCSLNDNDMNISIVDSDTGELVNFRYRNYYDIKKRKNRQLKPLLNKRECNDKNE